MVLTLGRAAKAVGRSKSALSRDVKAGKIPAVRNVDGSLSIDQSELFRVFPPVFRNTGSGNGATEVERNLLLDQIADLRRRLDAEAENASGSPRCSSSALRKSNSRRSVAGAGWGGGWCGSTSPDPSLRAAGRFPSDLLRPAFWTGSTPRLSLVI